MSDHDSSKDFAQKCFLSSNKRKKTGKGQWSRCCCSSPETVRDLKHYAHKMNRKDRKSAIRNRNSDDDTIDISKNHKASHFHCNAWLS
jgi:hypothetical protein